MSGPTLRGVRVLTVREVAKILGIAPSTVRRLAGEGKIPGTRIGKAWRFREDALLERLTDSRPAPQDVPPADVPSAKDLGVGKGDQEHRDALEELDEA